MGMSVWLLALCLLGAPPEQPPPPPPPVDAPVLVSSPSAERPSERPEQRVEVSLLLEIDASGQVVRAEVLESGGEPFDAAALAAARAFVFEPARAAGVPIPVEIGFRYAFPPLPPEPAPAPAPAPASIDETEVVRAIRVVRAPAAARMDRARAEQTPGAQGDVGRALETLGGVARPSLTGGELSIWGAAPADTRTYVDGVPVPRLFHLGGARTNLPGAMVEGVELTPAGFGVGWGRAIGGMIQIETRAPRIGAQLDEPDAHRVGGYARVDTLDAAAGVDARLGERGWIGAGVRRSLLRQVYGPLLGPDARALVPLPDTWDYQTKASVRLGERGRDELSVLVFGAHDELSRAIPSLSPDLAFSEQRAAGFHRLGLGLTRLRSEGSSLRLAAWAGLDYDTLEQRFSDARASREGRDWAGGLRVDERRRVSPYVVLAAGLDLEYRHGLSSRAGALSLPPREGDVLVFGQHPGERVARDSWGVHQLGLAAYLAPRFGPASGKWSVEPGLRVEPMISVGERVLPVRPIEPEVGLYQLEVAVDPRLSLRWRPLRGARELELFAAGGRYHQAPSAADRSPIFGNPRLRRIDAVQSLAGVRARPLKWLHTELLGFWIGAWHLPVRSPDPTPPVAELLRSSGRGRNYGGQLRARVELTHSNTGGVWLSLAYTLTRAERSLPSGAWRLFDGDQTHALQAVLAWAHRSGVELGARASLVSGSPRTPVDDAVFDGFSGRYDPIFGAQNSIRLPTFFELSLRAGWGRRFGWGRLRTWLDVRNVSNRANVEELFYSADFSTRGAIRGLPLLPVVGVEIAR